MLKGKYSALIFILFPVQLIFSQIDSAQTSIDEIIQNLIEESSDETDNSGLIDKIQEMIDNPIDINSASLTDLMNIPGIDINTANRIIKYRKNSGRIYSIAELNTLKSIDENTLNIIKLFLKVDPTYDYGDQLPQTKLLSIQLRNRISSNLQERDGFKNNKFVGNNLKTYSRFKGKYGHIHAGMTLDKDPGEKSYNDLFSSYLSFNDYGLFNKIIIGDYFAEFGQGLALWSPYSFSKSTDAIYPVKKNAHLIREYTSTDENKFFRGIATNLKFSNYNISLFYSKNNIDANIDTISGQIISTPVSGYHRTESELKEKNSANEKMMGGIINTSILDKFNLGLLFYHSEYSNSFKHQNIFDISGSKFNYYAFSYDIFFKNINLFGEIAYNEKSVASFTNLEISVTDDLTFLSSLRSYPRNYFNLHGFGFGEQSNTQNEFGIYNGIKLKTRFGVFNLYYDQFNFPFESYYSSLPSSGDEFLLNYFVSPFKGLTTSLKFKIENKDVDTDVGSLVQINNREKSSIRLELRYKVNHEIEIKNRVEISKYKIDKLNISENGFMVFQDIKFIPTDNFAFSGRIIFFRTDSFNTAIYEFENDLDGTYSITGLSNQGIRWYCLLKYKLFDMFKISVKYSEIYKPLEKSLGSGYTEINGNFDNQVSAQIEWNM